MGGGSPRRSLPTLATFPAAARALAALSLAALPILAAACGGDDGDAGGGAAAPALVWESPPELVSSPTLPDDRILTGRVENDSLRPVEVDAEDVRLVDGDGDRVDGEAIFLAGFGHALLPPEREPEEVPEFERRRTGRSARLEPGDAVPLTVSWRRADGDGAPVRIDYGSGSLPLP